VERVIKGAVIALALALAAAPAVGQTTAAAGPALRLAAPRRLARGAEALPQIAAPSNVITQRINGDLRRQDRIWLAGRAECLGQGKESYVERGARAAMLGPEFFALDVRHDAYCDGAAHPNQFPDILVYDLSTGSPVAWGRLLRGVTPHPPGPDAGWGDVSTLVTWSAAHRLYAAKARGGAGRDKTWWSECRDLVEQEEGDFYIWPDAGQHGLVLEPNWMPHAAQACGEAVVFSPADLRRLGADPRLIRALEAARS
jgi:hypothetical protein